MNWVDATKCHASAWFPGWPALTLRQFQPTSTMQRCGRSLAFETSLQRETTHDLEST
jgi:hypothetical protein